VLHPLLAGWWSSTRFDPAHRISDGDVELILEAARGAPSVGGELRQEVLGKLEQ
jgi:nitroreductase